MRKSRVSQWTAVLVSLFILLGMVAPVAAAPGDMTVVAGGLNNPRGLEFGPNGDLYVAEAGSGGSGLCAEGPEGLRCYGTSGSIARINMKNGSLTRVLTGLPSLAAPDGSGATGPHDVSFQGLGNMYFTIGYAGDPTTRGPSFGPGGAGFDQLARGKPNGKWSNVLDLGDYEVTNNPAGDEIDSNPYGMLALPGKQIVADAGANALLEVQANGKVKVLAIFENRMVPAPPFLGLPEGTLIPMDQVPTSVALGPDGAYYVGTLTGFPFPVDGAIVYRVPAEGGTPEVFATGLTHIIDLTFGPDGTLYVLEIAKNGLLAAFGTGDWTGALVKVTSGGLEEIASDGLFAPGGVVVGPDGAFYVTNYSILSGAGQVVRIEP